MKKKKISLIKDVNKVNIFQTKESKVKIIKDERVVNESNKIMAIAFNALICILVLGVIVIDIINIDISSYIIFIAIGIVSYIGLILMCRKNVIEGNEYSGTFFIWSFLTLPISIFNCIDDFVYQSSNPVLLIIVELIVTIILTVVLYQIANLIYKKYNQ